jgi:pyruvate formate lyase activating enzyme
MEGKISRREFLKKGAVAAAGLGVSAVAVDYLLNLPSKSLPSNLNQSTTTLTGTSFKEAMFYEKLDNDLVRCALCPNRCVISNGLRGLCGVRTNKDGRLYTLGYGNPCAVHVDPIEKKPLFHFLPATNAFSIATAGCCLRCKYCQNWQISQAKPDETKNLDMPPEKVVSLAKEYNAGSISYTYTEPTVFFEYMLETAKLARKEGIKNTIITCGYINPDPLEELCKYLDGGNVNLKGFSDEFYKNLTEGSLQPILDTMKFLSDKGKWFEITYLVVPQWSDDSKQIGDFIGWVKENLGVDRPIHFLRFSPAYKLGNLPPTPEEVLVNARNTALGEGINYVYIGNLSGLGAEHTYCPECGNVVIKRHVFNVIENNIENGRCKFCGKEISGFWG